ncbi:MAG: tetratricopeptide repeat protein [Chitinivibrionales bacterium]|nr:tetratricopeptide repeat protein [Chitinivibrionales bacterium]
MNRLLQFKRIIMYFTSRLMKRIGTSSLYHLVLILSFCLLLLGGCAYLNTFYNAKAYFNSSYSEHKKLMQEHPDSTIELPSNIAMGYDSAISKSLKVLDVYHKQEKWHDDAVFLMGKAHFYKKEHSRAIRRLRQVQKEFPQSPHVPESYLYLGKAYLQDGLLDKAEQTFNYILEKYPQLNKNEQVSVLIAEVAIRREGKAMALEILEKIRKSIKNPVEKMKLFLQIADLYMDLHQYDKAINLLKTSPRKRGLNKLHYRIDYALLSCYLKIDSLQTALDLADGMLKKKQYQNEIPAILLKKGAILVQMERYDDAIASYERITERYDTSDVVGEAWFELGIIYQKNKSDYEKAEECFVKAASLAKDPEIKERAAKRSEALKLLARYRGEPDSTDTASAADTATSDWGLEMFRIGELFWLSLDEPDSALKYYTALASDTLLRDDSLPKALYAAGWISRHAKNDTATSDSFFNMLIEKYPTNIYAKQAQQAKGEKVTIQTREDTAQYRFNSAEQKLFADDDMESAIEEYLKIYETYPDLIYGRRSIYAAAWLYDFKLEKNVTARDLYIELCDSFPESDLCLKEAKPRLQVVEDTLRVLRARKMQKENARKQSKKSLNKKRSLKKKANPPSPPSEAVSPAKPDSIFEADGE